MTESFLTPGQLWPRLVEQSRYALRMGALQPIATESSCLAVGETQFMVRILANLHRKKTTTQQQRQEKRNPFLPFEADLLVGYFSQTHLGLLNKFNAVDHHLLIVTRQFEDQQTPLNPPDFAAAVQVLQEKPGLIFYNSGPIAGASQPHRHLQWIPFPLGENGHAFPLASLFTQALTEPNALPFKLAIAPLTADSLGSGDGGHHCHQIYRQLLQQLDLHPDPSQNPCPYNLLMTADFLCVIPRSQESYQGIAVNALGFAGGLLVRDQAQLQTLKALGPFNLLQQVGIPQD
ncbi:MAG: ATP adenylyltransferase family protein [Synechocystis sp.]